MRRINEALENNFYRRERRARREKFSIINLTKYQPVSWKRGKLLFRAIEARAGIQDKNISR
jgi:hypothetical protein